VGVSGNPLGDAAHEAIRHAAHEPRRITGAAPPHQRRQGRRTSLFLHSISA
jgi:hypothetical protein